MAAAIVWFLLEDPTSAALQQAQSLGGDAAHAAAEGGPAAERAPAEQPGAAASLAEAMPGRTVLVYAETPDGRPLAKALEAEGLEAEGLWVLPIAGPDGALLPEGGTSFSKHPLGPLGSMGPFGKGSEFLPWHGPALVAEVLLPNEDVWVALLWNGAVLEQRLVGSEERAVRIVLPSGSAQEALVGSIL